MNIKDILPDSHRPTAELAAQMMIQKPEILEEFIAEIPKQEAVFAMRITRAMSIAYEMNPEPIHKYTGELIQILINSNNQGLNRGILKMFQGAWKVLTEEQLGQLLNVCFNCLENSAIEIALRVYSMNIIYGCTAIYPEMKNELLSIIEFHYEEGSAGFKAMSRKIIKKLKKNK